MADTADLLEALAAPFGTYFGVATCRPVPGAKTLGGIVTDVLWGLGKTEVLTRCGRPTVEVAESWLRAHDVRHLFVTGADALAAAVWVELCQLGGRTSCDIVFVSAQPSRWAAQLPGVLERGSWTYLVADPDRHNVAPLVGAALPDVGFPGLPAACAELLDADHAPRAQAIYDDCLTAAFEALPSDRMFGWAAAEYAFRCALEWTPDLDAVPLAMHAVRAAGLLRGYHIDFRSDRGVAFDDLLTADRLAQLSRLVSTRQAGAGVPAGMPRGGSTRTVSEDGAYIDIGHVVHVATAQARPLLCAWTQPDLSPARPATRTAPPRPSDHRRRLLWRKSPPEPLEVQCEPIDCREFRRIGDPPMDWTRPLRARRGR